MKKRIVEIIIYTAIVYSLFRFIDDSYNRKFLFLRISFFEILVEIIGVLVAVALIIFIHDKIKKSFDEKSAKDGSKQIGKELLYAFIACFIINNVYVVPICEFFTFDGVQLHDFVMINIIPSFLFMIRYTIIRVNYFFQAYVEHMVYIEKIKSEHLETELKFLKSQISPHFLFNSLNTIYFQMDESIRDAKQSIEKLSKMLRYRLYDQKEEKATLNEEYEYIENYIELQNTRFKDLLHIELNLDKTKPNVKIYPFLMLPLIENAFKFAGGSKIIHINSEFSENTFCFHITNTVEANFINQKPGGIGLENLKKRLNLLYPKKHVLITEKNNEIFSVTLQIQTDDTSMITKKHTRL